MENKENVIDIGNLRIPSIPSKTIGMGLAGILILAALFNTLYQVQPEEVGVVLRFSRYSRTSQPGLRMKIPFVESVLKVPIQRQLKQEFGFRTLEAGVRSQFDERVFADEAVMLTGDLNVAVVEWIVQYRVSDPYLFLFKVRNLEDTFRAMNEAVMRETVGDRTVTEVLTIGRQDIETQVQQQLQALVGQYEMGVTVEQVVLQDVNPPDPVKPSWDEVNQAQQNRDQLISEAMAEYNAVIPRARGEAEQAILQAEGYALDRVNRGLGDAARFTAVYNAYRTAPNVTRQRLYLETMQRILPQVGGKVFLDKDLNGLVPLLPLEGLLKSGPNSNSTTSPSGGAQ
jgi:membrane protease subunit HflK